MEFPWSVQDIEEKLPTFRPKIGRVDRLISVPASIWEPEQLELAPSISTGTREPIPIPAEGDGTKTA